MCGPISVFQCLFGEVLVGAFCVYDRIPRQWSEDQQEFLTDLASAIFRKTVATLIDKEANAKDAAGQLGHDDESITKKHYIVKPAVAPDSSHILEKLGPGRAVDDPGHGDRGPSQAA